MVQYFNLTTLSDFKQTTSINYFTIYKQMNTEFNGRKGLFWMGLWYYHNINMKNTMLLSRLNSLSKTYSWHLNSNFHNRQKLQMLVHTKQKCQWFYWTWSLFDELNFMGNIFLTLYCIIFIFRKKETQFWKHYLKFQ